LSNVANARPSSDSSTIDDASGGPTATNRKRVGSATSVSPSTSVGDRNRKYAMTTSSRKSTCPTSKLAHSVSAGNFRVSRLFGWTMHTAFTTPNSTTKSVTRYVHGVRRSTDPFFEWGSNSVLWPPLFMHKLIKFHRWICWLCFKLGTFCYAT